MNFCGRCLRSLLLGLAILWSEGAWAHAVQVQHRSTRAIAITARHGTEPLTGGQVVVFSPTSRAVPWQRGTLDAQGTYVFVPDWTVAGTWEVRVAQGGHGGVITIPIARDPAPKATPSTAAAPIPSTPQPEVPVQSVADFSPAQRAVMIGSVVWGFLGTALFFTRRRGLHARS
jgi:nickel transport protein